MSKFLGVLIVILSISLVGCRTTGYLVTLSMEKLPYSEIERIQNKLESRGFKIGVKEREILEGKVQTDLSMKLKNDPYWFLESYIKYKKNDENKLAQQVEIVFSNAYIGLITPEIKTQIDSLGNEFYTYVSGIVGKENVTIQSREWGPPRCYGN